MTIRWVILSLGLIAVGSIGSSAADQTPPNIIFILADDLGYGDLSCYGQRNFSTPNIDRLAAEGIRFTQHYSGSTVCGPSRACLMTGQHTGHVYQRGNGEVRLREDPQDVCVGTLLQQAGYHTALIGKSGLSCNDDDPSFPLQKGFEHFFGFVSHVRAHRYYPAQLARNGQWVDYPENSGKQGESYSGDLFLNDAIQYLRAQRKQPFFLHLSLQQPHADLCVPNDWKKQFLLRYGDEQPFRGGYYRAEPVPKATFAGMITYLDDTVGRIISELEALKIADNTLVLFSSDNGAMSEGGWNRHFFNSSGPLRGGKRDLYEGGIRVPLIAWWPGTIEGGRMTAHQSAFWDFLPTACDLAGIEAPKSCDGISYVKTLRGSEDQAQHEYFYWEFYEQGGKQAVRMGDWKGVRLNVQSEPHGPIELYNLSTDLGESHDVADDHRDVVAKIETIMREAHVSNGRYSLNPWRHMR